MIPDSSHEETIHSPRNRKVRVMRALISSGVFTAYALISCVWGYVLSEILGMIFTLTPMDNVVIWASLSGFIIGITFATLVVPIPHREYSESDRQAYLKMRSPLGQILEIIGL
jgi:membrane associated rhomboid family serine protease